MKNKLLYFLLVALLLFSANTVKSQEYYVKSNLENLEIEVGEVFEPSTYAVDEIANQFLDFSIIYRPNLLAIVLNLYSKLLSLNPK